jgi:hypothetical protein
LKPSGGPRIHHLLRSSQAALHLIQIADEHVIWPRREVALPWDRRHVVERAALGDPFRQSAVQHRHVAMPHGAEHPPYARSRENARTVVNDDPVSVAQAQLADAACEFCRLGKHMRQARFGVADFVDVKEYRARYMAFQELSLRVSPCGREIPGRVYDADVRRV